MTFVHLACSGASVVYGLLGRYTGVEKVGNYSNAYCNGDRSGPMDPGPPPWACITPQVDQAKEIVGDREIDAVYVSIGGNDAHFADIVVACITQNPCYQENWLSDNEAERDRTCGDQVWLVTVPGFFCHLFFDLLPDVDEDGNDAIKSAAQLWQEGRDGVVGDQMFKGHVTLFRDLARAVSGVEGSDGKLLTWDDRDRVFLSEYVDATQDTDGTPCGRPEKGILTIPGFSQHEFEWIASTVAPELNANVEAATQAHGWTPSTGSTRTSPGTATAPTTTTSYGCRSRSGRATRRAPSTRTWTGTRCTPTTSCASGRRRSTAAPPTSRRRGGPSSWRSPTPAARTPSPRAAP